MSKKLRFNKRHLRNKKIDELSGIKALNIKVKKLDSRATIPSYAHVGDVGMDATAIEVEYNEEYDMYVYHTGLAFESEYNVAQYLFLRSSNRKTDCYLCNGVGIADSAIYRGEIMFCYKSRVSTYERASLVGIKAYINALNEGKTPKECQEEREAASARIIKMTENLEFAPYKVGDKIGQIVFAHYPTVNLIETDKLNDTVRGANIIKLGNNAVIITIITKLKIVTPLAKTAFEIKFITSIISPTNTTSPIHLT